MRGRAPAPGGTGAGSSAEPARSDWNDLGDMYLRLARRGHEVRVCVRDPVSHPLLEGLLPRVASWEAELGWVREAGRDGIVLFEGVHDDQIGRAHV